MGKKEYQTSGALGIQVYELTMDNPEDQDELNRQLHKPGEPNNTSPAIPTRKMQDESTSKPDEMKSEGRKNSSRINGCS